MLVLLGFVALLGSPVWLFAVLVRLIATALPGRRPDWGLRLLRWSAGMAAGAAVGLYPMAAGAVQLSVHESRSGADSWPPPTCREDVSKETVRHLVDYRSSYLPPAFDCVLDDGTTYPGSSGYRWMNSLAVGFAGGTVLLAAGARFGAERRERVPVPAP
ncbi:hypothetical protein [Streptomyces sp. ID05-47C]|uniref:hypothetical protein n=1 Tax=Streptomyces sp. ID05-47C TaxID=3028665 RepID=UPI0029A12EF7|nr:hypothetical protein [Streptomyces sp. ID05-47C]MDX3573655.1 hypothetical protein [Streptomyces sp. ID05-47C]